MNKIIFLTRAKPNTSSANYLRLIKLVELFRTTFNWETEIVNFYKPLNKIKLIISTNRAIKAFCKKYDSNIKIIVICGLDPKSIKMIRKYALRHSIKLYIDIVELASAKEKKLGCLSPSLIMNHRIVKKSVTKDMTAIAISRFFENYYRSKDVPVVYIPNLYSKNVDDTTTSKPLTNKIKFGFIGYPYKKDSLDIIMKAMIKLYKNRGDIFEFCIAGITENRIFEKYKKLQKHKETIKRFTKFYGVVDRDSVKAIYSTINYSIIMRDPSLIVCQSGFPTKFVESLSYGRPVISNLTSDISSYLKNGYNGYIVDDYSADSLLKVLIDVVDKGISDNNIYNNALKSANTFFGIDNFVETLLKSYEKVIKK